MYVFEQHQALLRQNILHSSLLTHTAYSELAQNDRWAGWDVPRVIMMCTMLDVQNTALSLGRPPDAPQPSDAVRKIHDEGGSPLPSTSTHSVTAQSDKKVGIELQSTLFSENERPRVSVQDILGTYHVLKSRIDIEVVDPSPEWPHLLVRPPTSLSSLGADATPYRAFPRRSEDAIPAHVEEAISGLQRENLLLRTELNYELWLKRENVKRIGRLYEDRILVKGAEIERQGLVGFNLLYGLLSGCTQASESAISITNYGSIRDRCRDSRMHLQRSKRELQPPTRSMRTMLPGYRHD